MVDNPPPLDPGIVPTHIPCSLACIGKLQSTPAGGQSPYTFSWSTGSTNHSITNLCAGVFFLTLSDSRGCILQDTAEIVDLSYGTVVSTTQSKDTIYQGQSVQLNTTFISGYSYSWSPATGLNNANIHNPLASPSVTTTYLVNLIDIYGCSYSDTVVIVVLDVFCEEPYIFIPNAFTPNGDHQNEVLYVRTLYAESAYFAVFNRWGERLFETTDLNQGWDGTFRGTLSAPGVYVFLVEIKCFDGRTFTKKGNVTLIR
jgi:gliding motility-associated-like protein